MSSSDVSGGAQKVAWNLFRFYRELGQQSYLAVGYKSLDDPDILPVSHDEDRNGWSRFWWRAHAHMERIDRNGRLSRLARKLAEPAALVDTLQGIEDFHFPGTWRLLEMPPYPPDILHCHNLHLGYFDLRALPWLSHRVPTILTLHDAWLLSGHCAHSCGCERWRIGCGECPDLTLYPDVRRDSTALNWERKRQLYTKSRLYVATPSRWLMEKVEHSILALGIMESRVIPNGVDLTVFHPAEKVASRKTLGLPADAKVLLFAANGVRQNPWKDYELLRAAITRVASHEGESEIVFVALGEAGSHERIGRGEIRFVSYESSPQRVACYYQAADLYVHAAKVDTFPNTVLEALACGTPVVATAVGGIPEQVRRLAPENDSLRGYGVEQATGVLTPAKDIEALAAAMELLLCDELLRRRMSENAARDARQRFDLNRQVNGYMDWYREILAVPTASRDQAGFMDVSSKLAL